MVELENTVMNSNNFRSKKEVNVKSGKDDEKKERSKWDKIYRKTGFWLLFISIIVFIAVFLFMWLF